MCLDLLCITVFFSSHCLVVVAVVAARAAGSETLLPNRSFQQSCPDPHPGLAVPYRDPAAQKSRRGRPQIAGRLPFGGDPALLLSHFGGVELRLFCSDYMRLAIAPGPTVHWLFRSHDLHSKYRSISCSSVPSVLGI